MKRVAFFLALAALLLLLAGAAWAQTAGYNLSWWTVDGGGVTSLASGGYALGGTVGQPDAGVISGGGYTLGGGFWGGGAAGVESRELYLPLVTQD